MAEGGRNTINSQQRVREILNNTIEAINEHRSLLAESRGAAGGDPSPSDARRRELFEEADGLIATREATSAIPSLETVLCTQLCDIHLELLNIACDEEGDIEEEQPVSFQSAIQELDQIQGGVDRAIESMRRFSLNPSQFNLNDA